MPAEGRLAPQAKVGVNARRGLSEEDERDIAKPLTTRRGLAYTYLVKYLKIINTDLTVLRLSN